MRYDYAMDESDRLIAALKKRLKEQGVTYRQIGLAIKLSEQSVKRLFSTRAFTLARLIQLSSLAGLSLTEVMDEAQQMAAQIRSLSHAQETELIADTSVLLVAVCVLNSWHPSDITKAYRMTKVECLKKLLKLDRLGIITLLPGDRVRLNTARDFAWLQDGPIQTFFRNSEQDDFLKGTFKNDGEQFVFLHGMLTSIAVARVDTLVNKFREEFAALHKESQSAPFHQRHGVGILLAHREWEPRSFAKLRR